MLRSRVSRRDFLQRSVGIAAAWQLQWAAGALGFAEETPVCNTVAAEQEVGPYYVANELVRRDLREGKPGVLLRLIRLRGTQSRSHFHNSEFHQQIFSLFSRSSSCLNSVYESSDLY